MGMVVAQVLFVGTLLWVFVAVVRTQQHGVHRRTTSITLCLWLALTGLLAWLGWLSTFSTTPPRIAPLMLVAFVATLVFAFGPYGRRTLATTPLKTLVVIQSFRIVVEVVLLLLHRVDVVPVQMTLDGYNWDILTGLSAPFVAYLLSQGRIQRSVLLLWNSLGTLLLIGIVVISILSTPIPFRVFLNEPANTFIATVPFVWLPLFLVPVALWSHLLVFRSILGKGRPESLTG